MVFYSPGTQENYNSFSPGNPITKKGKELEYRRGERGLEATMWPLTLTTLRVIEGTGGSPCYKYNRIKVASFHQFRDFLIRLYTNEFVPRNPQKIYM